MVGPPEFWREKREFQIKFLKEQGLRPHHTFVDIGCGTLRGGIPVIKYLEVQKYVGLEVRPEVVAQAREELAREGLEDKAPELVMSNDFAALSLDHRFDYAWAFSVLIHMADEIARECLAFVGRHLGEGGAFYANVKLGQPVDAQGGRGFPVVTRPLAFYDEIGRTAGLQVDDLGTLASLGHRMGLSADDHHMLRFTRRAP